MFALNVERLESKMTTITSGARINSHLTTTPRPKSPVRLCGIALPIEHGSWGILFEPLVAAVAVALSASALWITIIFIGAFLMRQPLRIMLADTLAGRELPQTAAARRFMIYYSAILIAGVAGSWMFTQPSNFLPLLLACPFAVIQIYYDVARQSRRLLPELAGVIALSSSAAIIALAGGWTLPAAAALWALLIFRLIPSILYVRNRLRLEKGKAYSFAIPVVAHALAVAAAASLAYVGLSPILPVAMLTILTGRAALGLSPLRRKRKAMQIGIFETVYGALMVLSVIFGHYFQL